jgi:quercetin dioxygenase-like cupin family protein
MQLHSAVALSRNQASPQTYSWHMKNARVIFFLLFGFCGIQKAFAQDLCATNKQYCKLLSDTAGVKMILVTLPPKAKLQTHTHPVNMGYVIQGGLYKWTYVNGATESSEMKAGDHFLGGPERPHYSWNGGNTTIQFVLVETDPFKEN